MAAPRNTQVDLREDAAGGAEVVLEAGSELIGVLLDEEGHPLSGVELFTVFGEPRVMRRARTDDDGRFRFAGLPTAGDFEIRSEVLVVTVTLPSPPVTLRVPKRHDVEIAVVAAESGAPLEPPGGLRVNSGTRSWIVEIGRGGVVQLRGVPTGPLNVEVLLPDRGLLSKRVTVRADGTVRPSVLAVPRGGCVRGCVTDATGRPVAGARIVAHGTGALRERETTSGADGEYDIGALDARSLLVVEAQDLAVTWRVIDATGSPDDPVQADFRLGRGGAVRGRVRRTDGSAVAGALVKTHIAAAPHLPFVLPSALTDESGTFVLEYMPVIACVVGTGTASEQVKPAHDTTIDIELVV